MKKVVFLSLRFARVTTNQNLYTDLMVAFQRNGHEVLVVAPTLEENGKLELYNEAGIDFLRVPTLKLFGGGLIQKGLANVLLPFQFKRALKKSNIKLDFDLVIIATPPITLISVANWLKKKSQAKLYLILRDIFPQNAVDLNMMSKNGILFSYFRKLEAKLYRLSDSIGCMSRGNIEYVKEHNKEVDFSKLHLLPNWQELKESDSIKNMNVREKYGLQDKIVAIYGGNLGLPQQLENIIELAETVEDLEDLVFLIIGYGTERDRIIVMAEQKGLKNVIFLEGVNRDEYNEILRNADIGLISLNKDFTIPNYPSKVTAYYALKKPVLAAVDANTDFGIEQEEIGCGLYSVSGDVEAFKKNLLRLYSSKKLRDEMGLRGYNHLKTNLTPQGAYEMLISQF